MPLPLPLPMMMLRHGCPRCLMMMTTMESDYDAAQLTVQLHLHLSSVCSAAQLSSPAFPASPASPTASHLSLLASREREKNKTFRRIALPCPAPPCPIPSAAFLVDAAHRCSCRFGNESQTVPEVAWLTLLCLTMLLLIPMLLLLFSLA